MHNQSTEVSIMQVKRSMKGLITNFANSWKKKFEALFVKALTTGVMKSAAALDVDSVDH